MKKPEFKPIAVTITPEQQEAVVKMFNEPDAVKFFKPYIKDGGTQAMVEVTAEFTIRKLLTELGIYVKGVNA